MLHDLAQASTELYISNPGKQWQYCQFSQQLLHLNDLQALTRDMWIGEQGLRETYVSYGALLRQFLGRQPSASRHMGRRSPAAAAVSGGPQAAPASAHSVLLQQRGNRAAVTVTFTALLILGWMLQQLGIPLRALQLVAQ